MKIVISSGHGANVSGANDLINEVREARRVVDRTAPLLRQLGVTVVVFHENTATSQSANLNNIIAAHNAEQRDLDVSVHFNSSGGTVDRPIGTEVLWVTQQALAGRVSKAIASAGKFIDRGGKKRTDLAFLNKTTKPAILIEVCFVNSREDVRLYQSNFEAICAAIAQSVSGSAQPPAPGGKFNTKGKCSSFGGPDDTGVTPTEGLAFISSVEQMPQLFLPFQPPGTTGLARRLNPWVNYVACRWDYSVTPKPSLLQSMAMVKAVKTGISLKAFPADWGPNQNTGRVADLSPSLMENLGIKTDDEVEVIFPI